MNKMNRTFNYFQLKCECKCWQFKKCMNAFCACFTQIFGMIMIGVGAAVEIKYRSLVQLTGSAISAAPVLVICIGVFIFIIGECNSQCGRSERCK